MAKAEEKHRSEFKALPEHSEKSGCIVRCQSTYVEKHAHSHRWQAAERARSRPDIYPISLDKPRWLTKSLDFIERLRNEGGVAAEGAAKGGKAAFSTKPFVRTYSPWPHNAHHIIPMSVLWNEVIKKAEAKVPEEKQPRMLNLIMRGVLTEPYNHNAEPNMVLLPTADREAKLLGLPKHLEQKEKDHPKYSALIKTQITGVHTKYDGLAKDVEAEKHEAEIKPAQIRTPLEDISDAVFEALVAVAKVNKGKAQTLDDSVAAIAAQMSSAAAK
jgi:hypothetical protein